jgi:hypothetical protein
MRLFVFSLALGAAFISTAHAAPRHNNPAPIIKSRLIMYVPLNDAFDSLAALTNNFATREGMIHITSN